MSTPTSTESVSVHAPIPLAPVLRAMAALNDALSGERFPEARHHARLVELRGKTAGLLNVAACASVLMAALDSAIRPASGAWNAVMAELNRTIEEAIEAEIGAGH